MSDDSTSPEARMYNKGVADTIGAIRYFLSSPEADPRYRLGEEVTAAQHLLNARLLLGTKLNELSRRAS